MNLRVRENEKLGGITLCGKPSSSPLESSCALKASLLVVVGEWSANKIVRKTFVFRALLSHIYYLNTYFTMGPGSVNAAAAFAS